MLRKRSIALAATLAGAAGLAVLSSPWVVVAGAAAPEPQQEPRAHVTRSASGFTLLQRDGLDIEARDYLGTPASEAAVRRGLEFLARTQSADGSWGPGTNADVGIVGLAAMAFLSAGHQPDRGPYGDVVRRATDYLATHTQRSGLMMNEYHGANAGGPMYSHGFATLALAELYGMTRRSDLRDKLERAVDLIVRTQNEEGGWRYHPRVADADLSIVVCQVMALRAAHNAGVPVPDEVVDRAVEYVRSCGTDSYDGSFRYRGRSGRTTQALTGAGVLCLIVMGRTDLEETQRGIEYLMGHTPDAAPTARSPGNTFYMLYYCTQAMYQAGDEAWQRWFPQTIEFLLTRQRTDGAWQDDPGLTYGTAMGVLTLQVPASLLPIYQK